MANIDIDYAGTQETKENGGLCTADEITHAQVES